MMIWMATQSFARCGFVETGNIWTARGPFVWSFGARTYTLSPLPINAVGGANFHWLRQSYDLKSPQALTKHKALLSTGFRAAIENAVRALSSLLHLIPIARL